MTPIPYGDLPHHHALRQPDALALCYPDGRYSWSEFDRRTTRRARLLQSLGVRPDDMVTIALPNGCLYHETSFAVWKCGAIPNIVSSKLPAHEFRAIVELVQPRLVVGGNPAELKGFECLDPLADIGRFLETPFPALSARYWKATTSGGSTGRPKVIVDHKPPEIDLDAPLLPTVFRMRSGMTVLNPGPLYHNAPFTISSLALFMGCSLVGMERFDAEEALRLIEHHRVNLVMLVPTMMHRIWKLPSDIRQRYDLSSLETVWHLGAPCPAWLKAAWIEWLGPDRIWEIYGSTEAMGATAIGGEEWLKKPGTVGRTVGSLTQAVRIVGEDNRDCAPGEVGEIYFKVPPPEALPYHYIGAEPKRSADGWESVGDMGYLDEDGYLFISDRRTDMILRGGANIYPAEVEAALDEHPQVASSVVVGLPCEDLGQRVHAIVQAKSGETLDLQELHRFVGTKLTRYKLPESYELTEQPLRDDAGKVRRLALKEERALWQRSGRSFQVRVEQARPVG